MSFVLSPHASVDIGTTKMMTHYLEKNEKLSVWDICEIEKGPTDSIDGYKELHSIDGAEQWEAAKLALLRQRQILFTEMRHICQHPSVRQRPQNPVHCVRLLKVDN
ncbi:hypothetical protein OESDEN_08988 [Oesophagostomum dentatum]|uniref:Uncharacterized protein n=1 Tax=Oesophagostomum dentatum TaxID=61180 RepID=A0A0B1T1R6_OESDE|nr:hypothetical protein OESDEN_08988 [Oesophagostomum dentatum]